MHFAPPPPFSEGRSHWREQFPNTQRERTERTRSRPASRLGEHAPLSCLLHTLLLPVPGQLPIMSAHLLFVKKRAAGNFLATCCLHLQRAIRYTKCVNGGLFWEVSTKCKWASSRLRRTSENLKWLQAKWPQINKKKKEGGLRTEITHFLTSS